MNISYTFHDILPYAMLSPLVNLIFAFIHNFDIYIDRTYVMGGKPDGFVRPQRRRILTNRPFISNFRGKNYHTPSILAYRTLYVLKNTYQVYTNYNSCQNNFCGNLSLVMILLNLH